MFVLPRAQGKCRFLHEHHSGARSAFSHTQADSRRISICKITRKPSVLSSSDNETHDRRSCSRRQYDWSESPQPNNKTNRIDDGAVSQALILVGHGVHIWPTPTRPLLTSRGDPFAFLTLSAILYLTLLPFGSPAAGGAFIFLNHL